jgi:endonuclease YncB( thermonuclease family)
VVDGDTLALGKQRIRLNGIDAPETSQICQDNAGSDYRCGQVAAKALDDWLARSRPTRCVGVGLDQYDRVVADCFRADGLSVQKWLVRNGHALDWPRYSKGAYAADQAAAKAAQAGLWQGRFEAPWDFRATERSSSVTTPKVVEAPNACVIKGNISQDGKRIYHVPGQEHYDRTQINIAGGEQWFCTEREAKSAGWRKARR